MEEVSVLGTAVAVVLVAFGSAFWVASCPMACCLVGGRILWRLDSGATEETHHLILIAEDSTLQGAG